MQQPPIYYKIEHDEDTDTYVGYCPSMRPVRFFGKNEGEVEELVRDGITLYMRQHPDFFNAFKKLEV